MKHVFLSTLRQHAQGHHYGSTTFAKLAHFYLSSYLNHDYDPMRNGEYNLLHKLRGYGLRIFFDVGANQGEWSNFVAFNFPNAEIHAFEIIPRTSQNLRRRVNPRVNVNDFGLSNTDGNCEDVVYNNNDMISSLVTEQQNDIHNLASSSLRVSIVRGDAYCVDHQISCVDFMKIDVEGAEHKVILGFGNMVRSGVVKIIQFEYGMANIYTKFLLRDYYQLLGERYFIGRLCPDGVHFSGYDPREENFRSPNFVAVERSQQALLDRVGVA